MLAYFQLPSFIKRHLKIHTLFLLSDTSLHKLLMHLPKRLFCSIMARDEQSESMLWVRKILGKAFIMTNIFLSQTPPVEEEINIKEKWKRMKARLCKDRFSTVKRRDLSPF